MDIKNKKIFLYNKIFVLGGRQNYSLGNRMKIKREKKGEPKRSEGPPAGGLEVGMPLVLNIKLQTSNFKRLTSNSK